MAASPALNLHSRLVLWLKILLPLAALGLLATLFLFGHNVRPEDAIPYADGTVADRVKEPRVTAPAYAGVTKDGADLKITAVEARPGVTGSTKDSTASDVHAKIVMPNGSVSTILSATATMDQAAGVALLQGGVTLYTSTNYTVKSLGMRVGLNETDITSLAPVTGTGPLGRFTAQNMHLRRGPTGGYLLDFDGGVNLIYTPSGG